VTRQRYKTLATRRHLTAAAKALAAQCSVMKVIHARTGTPPLRDFTAGFAGLAKIVTGQQLSAASASAIWKRVESGVVPFEPATLLAMPDQQLAALGLSGGKIRTLKAIAAAIADDGFDIEGLAGATDAVIIEQLTALHGIGPWTADIYLLFALRRADAFAPGDLALQLAAQHHFKLKSRPTPAELEEIAERWRPWRGAAARLLWADYSTARAQLTAAKSKSTAKKPAKRASRR
jgi:DNA-3-methyladenine glycosylase II